MSSHWKRINIKFIKICDGTSLGRRWSVGIGAAGSRAAPAATLLSLFWLFLGLPVLVFPFPEFLLTVPQLPVPVQFLELVSRFSGVLVGFTVVVTQTLTQRRGQKPLVGSGRRNSHRTEGLPFDFVNADFLLKLRYCFPTKINKRKQTHQWFAFAGNFIAKPYFVSQSSSFFVNSTFGFFCSFLSFALLLSRFVVFKYFWRKLKALVFASSFIFMKPCKCLLETYKGKTALLSQLVDKSSTK